VGVLNSGFAKYSRQAAIFCENSGKLQMSPITLPEIAGHAFFGAAALGHCAGREGSGRIAPAAHDGPTTSGRKCSGSAIRKDQQSPQQCRNKDRHHREGLHVEMHGSPAEFDRRTLWVKRSVGVTSESFPRSGLPTGKSGALNLSDRPKRPFT
jgi:hypothetical protein